MWLLTFQLFKNSIDTQEKLRLNLHSLSVSELLEYGRNSFTKYKDNTMYFLWEIESVKNTAIDLAEDRLYSLVSSTSFCTFQRAIEYSIISLARNRPAVACSLKARLHGRFLLRFYLRFFPFGGYEGVDYLVTLLWNFITWNIYNSSAPSHPPKGENRNWNRNKNIARVNGP